VVDSNLIAYTSPAIKPHQENKVISKSPVAVSSLFLFVASLAVTPVKANENNTDVSVIRNNKEVQLVFEQCSRMTPTFRTSYQALDRKTVEKVEALLPQALKKAAKGDPSIKLDDYYRQYVGYGLLRREMVYVNALSKKAIKQWASEKPSRSELLNDWRNKAISVCGGARNYWGALYDGQTGQITEVLFNTVGRK